MENLVSIGELGRQYRRRVGVVLYPGGYDTVELREERKGHPSMSSVSSEVSPPVDVRDFLISVLPLNFVR